MSYICPLCRAALSFQKTMWRCDNNHCFDIAKEGYVNLLPVQNKNSKDPGDNKIMMQARRDFLNAGYYQPLSDRINLLAQQYITENTQILDLGCGEGYYSSRLQQLGGTLYGLDISKAAIKYAAKKYKSLQFCVASAYDMPFESDAFDLVLKVYAPSKLTELIRVSKPNSIFICVTPGPRHHFQMKELIYEYPKEHEPATGVLDGFSLIHQERLQWQMTLPSGKVTADFLAMTPYAWKLRDEQKQQLQQQKFTCELDFQIEVYQCKKLVNYL